jgi:hypothetical protein
MSILLEQLDQSVMMVLEECDSTDMPNVYALKSTQDGVKSIIKMVRKRVIQQKMGIYEALQAIESEFTEI